MHKLFSEYGASDAGAFPIKAARLAAPVYIQARRASEGDLVQDSEPVRVGTVEAIYN